VDDLSKGIIDRYRSLPMSPAALLIGRTVSDLLTSVATLVVMIGMGLAVGWRIHTSPVRAAAGCLLLLFAFALSWVMATVGLSIRTPEVHSNAAVLVIIPMSFVANTFVNPGGRGRAG
jgi:ABC-2 type transport system permease protein